jgi:hypothetical protein
MLVKQMLKICACDLYLEQSLEEVAEVGGDVGWRAATPAAAMHPATPMAPQRLHIQQGTLVEQFTIPTSTASACQLATKWQQMHRNNSSDEWKSSKSGLWQ